MPIGNKLITLGFLAAVFLAASPEWRWDVAGLPVYWSEAAVLALALGTALRYGPEAFSGSLRILRDHPWCVSGAVLMLAGMGLSLIAFPATERALGIAKAWFGFPILLGWTALVLGERGRTTAMLTGLWGGVTATALVSLFFLADDQLTFDGRLQGVFASPNLLAMHVSVSALVGWYLFRTARPGWTRSLLLIGSGVSLVALWHTYSYTAWISLVIGGAVVGWYAGQASFRRAALLSAIVCTLGGLALLTQTDNPKLAHWFDGSGRSSLDSRLMIWKAAGRMLSDHPMLGIGLGRFQETYLEYQRYFLPYLEWAVPTPHNLILMFWLSLGLLGAAGFVLMLWSWACAVFHSMKNPASGGMAALCLGWLATVLVQGVFDTPYWRTDLAYQFWIFLALGLIAANRKAPNVR